MVRTFFLALLFLTSCNRSNEVFNEKKLFIYSLNNKILQDEIIKYEKTVKIPKIKDKIVQVQVSQIEDTTFYKISFGLSAFGIISTPATVFINVEGKITAMRFEGVNGFAVSNDFAWDILKNVFVDEYKYYRENNEFLPPPTAREITWVLSFKGKSFLKKEIINE